MLGLHILLEHVRLASARHKIQNFVSKFDIGIGSKSSRNSRSVPMDEYSGGVMKKNLKKLSAGKVTIFKIKNRRGFAAVSLNNLTEGNTPVQAFNRMTKALKRLGFELNGSVPRLKSI